MDAIERVREYKKLLDEGIITEEEYETRRVELLGLKKKDEGTRSAGGAQDDGQETVKPAAVGLVKCVKCGESYSGNLEACPHCQFKPDLFVCPVCGALYRKFDKACRICGNPTDLKALTPATREQITAAVKDTLRQYETAETLKDWERVEQSFAALNRYYSSDEQQEKCKQKISELKEAEEKENDYQSIVSGIEETTRQAALSQLLGRLEEHLDHEGAAELKEKGFAKWQELAYDEACKSKKPKEAKELFDKLDDYKDAKEKSAQCAAQIKKNDSRIKKIAVLAGTVIAAVIVIALVANMYVIPKGHYDKGMTAYKAGDYVGALNEFKQSKGFKDTAKMTTLSNYKAGEAALEAESYSEAAAFFGSAGKYKDAKKLTAYSQGMHALGTNNYGEAYDYFVAADGIRDSAEMIKACDLLEAEYYYQEGDLDEAQSLFKELPKDYTYGGISVKQRLDSLDKHSDFIKILGYWDDTDGYMEVRQTHDSTGIWNNWSAEDPGGELSITACKIKDDGKVEISGTVGYWKYTEYSSLGSVVESGEVYDNFSFTETVSGMPDGLKIGTYTKLTISGNTAKVNYYKYSPDEDVYFTYFYKTDMTFKK